MMQPQKTRTGGMGDVLIRIFDWPPVWTLAAVVAVWVLGWVGFPIGFGVYGPGLAVACLIIGLWLMIAAVMQMRARKTTLNPRGQPTALVTDGVFALSRNPIYLGDFFVVLAATFWWDAPLGLVLAGGFIWAVNDRFIGTEEERLADAFGEEAAHWFLKVRRWI